MAWIALHQQVDGAKLRETYRSIGCCKAECIGVLSILWMWGIDNAAENGEILAADVSDLAAVLAGALSKSVKPARVIAALIKHGWIDETDGVLYFHDWQEWQAEFYKGKAERKRKADYYRQSKDNGGKLSGELDGELDGKYPENSPENRSRLSRSPSPSPSPSEKEITNAYAREGSEADEEPAEDPAGEDRPSGQRYACFREYDIRIRPIGKKAMEMLSGFLDDGMEDAMICAVLAECEANGGQSPQYVQSALQKCLDIGVKTLGQYRDHLAWWKAKTAKGPPGGASPPEIVPMSPEEKQAFEEAMKHGKRPREPDSEP